MSMQFSIHKWGKSMAELLSSPRTNGVSRSLLATPRWSGSSTQQDYWSCWLYLILVKRFIFHIHILLSITSTFTLQPTASRTLSTTMADRSAMMTLGWSSLTAGQKVITRTEPERQRATTMVHHLSHSNGRIHRTLCREQCVSSNLFYKT